MDVIKTHLPSQNKASLALDRWPSKHTSAMPLVIAKYMDQNWALREVQWAFAEVDSPFDCNIQRSLRITRQWATYWNTVSRPVEGIS
jgi:hypothetical protein